MARATTCLKPVFEEDLIAAVGRAVESRRERGAAHGVARLARCQTAPDGRLDEAAEVSGTRVRLPQTVHDFLHQQKYVDVEAVAAIRTALNSNGRPVSSGMSSRPNCEIAV